MYFKDVTPLSYGSKVNLLYFFPLYHFLSPSPPPPPPSLVAYQIFLFIFCLKHFEKDMPRCVCRVLFVLLCSALFGIYPSCCPLRFLELCLELFVNVEKLNPSHFFQEIFIWPHSFSLSEIPTTCWRLFDNVPHYLGVLSSFLCSFFFLCFIFSNFYWPVFKFTDSLLRCVKSTGEFIVSIPQLYYGVCDWTGLSFLLLWLCLGHAKLQIPVKLVCV